MESHVSGSITPLNLGELRQAVLAVLIGNPLFTEEEQLLANHLTYECEDAERLARWLRNVRLQDARRAIKARNLAAYMLSQPAICLNGVEYIAEMQALAQCRLLNKSQQEIMLLLKASTTGSTATRLRWVGHGYVTLLENMGRIPKPTGFDALKDN